MMPTVRCAKSSSQKIFSKIVTSTVTCSEASAGGGPEASGRPRGVGTAPRRRDGPEASGVGTLRAGLFWTFGPTLHNRSDGEKNCPKKKYSVVVACWALGRSAARRSLARADRRDGARNGRGNDFFSRADFFHMMPTVRCAKSFRKKSRKNRYVDRYVLRGVGRASPRRRNAAGARPSSRSHSRHDA